MTDATTLTIDLDAIAENYRTLAAIAAPAACGAVVKADAYGLGVGPVAKTLRTEGCGSFFVATPSEGRFLRGALGEQDTEIFILNGPTPGANADAEFREERLIPALNSLAQLSQWKESGGGPAAIALDTGMARLGLSEREVRALASDSGLLEGIDVSLVFSHLACAEESDNPMNADQRARFDRLRADLPAARASLANSGGVFLGTEFAYDLVRPGAALFGVSEATGATEKLRQVVRLQGKILQVRDVDTDMTVGYGAKGFARRGARLATVDVGYADGYLRSLSERGHAYFGETHVPLSGRVSMDLTVFDVSDVPPPGPTAGDTIDLISDTHGVDALATEAGTIGYEILTSLGSRYRREYVGGPDNIERTAR